MLTLTGGRERTVDELRNLFDSSGLGLTGVIDTPSFHAHRGGQARLIAPWRRPRPAGDATKRHVTDGNRQEHGKSSTTKLNAEIGM